MLEIGGVYDFVAVVTSDYPEFPSFYNLVI
jgi:hypothetical protein